MAEINELGTLLGLLQQGFTPDQARQQLDEAKAMQMAKMTGREMTRMGLIQGGQDLRRGLMAALGQEAQDPTLQMASQVRQLGSQFDLTTADGMMQYARALQQVNPQMAQQAAMQAQKMMQQEALVGKTRAEAQKVTAQAGREEETYKRERQLQEALGALPPDAPEEQLLGVLYRYGKPEQVTTALTRVQDRRAQIEAKAEAERVKAEAKLTADLEKAKTQAERDAANRAHQIELERLRQEGRQSLATLAASLKSTATQDKPVDDKAGQRFEAITASQPIIDEGDALITKIKPPGGPAKEVFGLGSRGAAYAMSALGRRTEAGGVISDVNSFLERARNAYLLAAKGTQTEGDAQRAWNQIQNKLDFTTADGAEAAIKRVQEELRRQQQAARSYLNARGFKAPEQTAAPAPAPAAAAPAAPKATKRFNPATGQIEDIK
jgi:hypothetical protein